MLDAAPSTLLIGVEHYQTATDHTVMRCDRGMRMLECRFGRTADRVGRAEAPRSAKAAAAGTGMLQ